MPKLDKKSKVCIESNDQTVRTTLKGMDTKEHDKVYSRTLRRDLEIGVGMHGTSGKIGDFGGLVPSNPFSSELQSRFAHANPSKFGGESGLKEWDKATDYSTLPKKAKKK
jgi:hypothetical protein